MIKLNDNRTKWEWVKKGKTYASESMSLEDAADEIRMFRAYTNSHRPDNVNIIRKSPR